MNQSPKETVTIPDEVIALGRTEKGQFTKGRSGNPNGRPRGMDFRATVTAKAKEHGYDLPTAIWEVTKALIENAKAGNVAAAKLILDKFCDDTPEGHSVMLTVDRE